MLRKSEAVTVPEPGPAAIPVFIRLNLPIGRSYNGLKAGRVSKLLASVTLCDTTWGLATDEITEIDTSGFDSYFGCLKR